MQNDSWMAEKRQIVLILGKFVEYNGEAGWQVGCKEVWKNGGIVESMEADPQS